MKPYQQRVVDEKAELDAKLERLQAFLVEDPPDAIDEAERGRMGMQAHIMAEYSAILAERIANFT